MEDGFNKVTLSFNLDKNKITSSTKIGKLNISVVGKSTDYNGEVYFDNITISKPGSTTEPVPVPDSTIYDFEDGTEQGWTVGGWGDKDIISVSNEQNRLKAQLDYSANAGDGWAQSSIGQSRLDNVDFAGKDSISCDFYYRDDLKTAGNFTLKLVAKANVNGTEKEIMTGDGCIAVTDNADLPSEVKDGWTKKTVTFQLDGVEGKTVPAKELIFVIVGRNTDYKGAVYFDNIKIFKETYENKGYVTSTIPVGTKTVISDTATALSVNGTNYNYADSVKLADDQADKKTLALYQYLKAVGESSSVIYGHMEDTVLKAGSSALSYSDTEDVTGSISAIDGLDCGGHFSGFANKFISRYPEEAEKLKIVDDDSTAEDDIKAAAAFSNISIQNGAIITLSSHMPNFAYAEKKENADSINKTYDKFNYLKDSYELTGDCMNNILPGGEFNEAYRAHLDLIAEYAKLIEGPVLFRPLHENTGGWFWWGNTFCTPDTYKSVFKYTVDYMRDVKGIHNFIYLYGPGSEAANEAEYEERYPGDGYVDMVGFDSYDDSPNETENYTFQNDFKNTIRLTNSFAKKHNKLFAVTETGIKNPNDKALLPTGNGRKDWYNEILDIVTDKEFNCCYFMLWSNYSSSGSYYTSFVVSKNNDDNTLTGHEMLDNFISFYNDQRSIFASDQKGIISDLESIQKPQNAGKELDGYITAPVSGNRILDVTNVQAQLNMATDKEILLTISGNGKNINLETKKDATGKVYSAVITKENLNTIGEALQGKISLYADGKLLQEISVIFNVEEKELPAEQVDDFEAYGGAYRTFK